MNASTTFRHAVFGSLIPALMGFAAGYAACRMIGVPASEQESGETAVATSAPAPKAPIRLAEPSREDTRAHDEALSENMKLRNRIRELEDKLAKRAGSASAEHKPRTRPEDFGLDPAQRVKSRNETFQQRMERMKSENPEQYREITERHQGFRDRMHAEHAARREFFESLDTSDMTEEQRADHESLLDAISLCDSATDFMGPDATEPLTPEENQRVFESMRSLGPLMQKERRFIFEAMGRAYGEDGGAFADAIQSVLDATSMNGPIVR